MMEEMRRLRAATAADAATGPAIVVGAAKMRLRPPLMQYATLLA